MSEVAADQELIDRLHKEAEEHDKWSNKERERLIQVAADEDTFEPEGINMRNFFDEIQAAKSGKQKRTEKKEATPVDPIDPTPETPSEAAAAAEADPQPQEESVTEKVKDAVAEVVTAVTPKRKAATKS